MNIDQFISLLRSRVHHERRTFICTELEGIPCLGHREIFINCNLFQINSLFTKLYVIRINFDENKTSRCSLAFV